MNWMIDIHFKTLIVKMICDINPEYKQHMVYTNNGRQQHLYAKVKKAVYGTLMGAILFYNKLSNQLEDWGFEKSPYDECTFNKIVDGEQLTIQYHIGNCIILCKHKYVVDQFLNQLSGTFGVEKELSITTGNVCDYLGMTIDFSLPGRVVFTMFGYLEDIILEAPADMRQQGDKDIPTPAIKGIFDVDKISKPLDPATSDLFHRLVAQLLFAFKREHPDLQVAIAFLCTCVCKLTQQDYRKIATVIQYLECTIHLPLILGSDDKGTNSACPDEHPPLTWNVDASYTVHHDMCSHTEACLSFGTGVVLSLSCKQKLVTKSSTEAELVGVDNTMTFVMWAKYFFEAQAADLPKNSKLKNLGKHNIIEQNNTSALQLERNGKHSSPRQTKHINICYFYVTNKVKDGTVQVTYKPTTEMPSNYLTTSLTDSLFTKHQATLLGLESYDKYPIFYKRYKAIPDV